MTLFQIWTMCWQIAVVVTPLLIATCFMWLRTQFVTKVEFASAQTAGAQDRADIRNRHDTAVARLDDHRNDHESRLKLLEVEVARPPSRHTLNNAVTTLQGGIHALERGFDDMRRQSDMQSAELRRQVETLNAYLHTMIEKHLS